jgi:ketosteroid isomerase-like protein
MALYSHNLDQGKLDAWLAQFTDDIVWNTGDQVYRGKAEVEKWASESRKGSPPMRHVTTNYVVDVTGSDATLLCYLTLLMLPVPGKLKVQVAGTYTVQLTKASGQWLIREMVFRLDMA